MRVYFDEQANDYICDAGTPEWRVTEVSPQADYTLILTFVGGGKRIYNAIPLLEKNIYSPLKNLSFFMSAKVEGDTVVWNEDVDIAPEHLFEQSVPIGGVV